MNAYTPSRPRPPPRTASTTAWRPKNTPFKIWKMVSTYQVKMMMVGERETEYEGIGRWLKDALVELGPAFIKMGQFVSTRSDVLPKGINAELKKLQDNITPTPFEDIQTVLMEEFGSLYEQVFVQIDPVPIASASIGQVHRAVLRKGNVPVVMKIQKPYVGEQIRSDLEILKTICRAFQWLNLNGRAAEFERILRQYEDFLGGELDYETERDHMQLFKEKLAPVPSVVIPTPYVEYSTRRVLVMEDVPSVKITDYLEDAGADAGIGEALAAQLVDVFLYQIIFGGVVHCDPHPGNIGVDDEGRLVLYDFGNVADLGEAFQSKVRQLVVAVYQKDVDEFIELLLAMKILKIGDSMDVLELKHFFVYVFDYLETVDFQKLRMSVLENDVLKNSQLNVQIAPSFLSLFRVFSLLDGTCLKLDPKFSYLPVLQPYFEDILRDFEFMDYRMRRDFQKLTAFPKMIQNTESTMLQMNRRMERMNVQTQTLQYMIMGVAVWSQVAPLVMWWMEQKP